MSELEERFEERLDELDHVDEAGMHERYDQMLDECSESCNMCKQYGASRILAEVDPVAYRCGYNDWLDGEEVEEIGENYYNIDEVQALREEIEQELEDENEAEIDKIK